MFMLRRHVHKLMLYIIARPNCLCMYNAQVKFKAQGNDIFDSKLNLQACILIMTDKGEFHIVRKAPCQSKET